MTTYSNDIVKSIQDGTERSTYKPIGNFFERYIKANFKKDIIAIAEQSSRNYEKGVGFPDIAIKENDFTLGYIEVKLPTDNIDDKKFKEQFARYKGSLENIIFTNLKIWQLWQWDKDGNSKKIKEILFDYENPKDDEFKKLLDKFVHFTIIQATTPKQLAINLAKRTKLLASILELYKENTHIQDTKEAFKRTLLHDIDDSSFTNLISETFTYSLFIATLEHYNSGKSDGLTLTTAIDYIPKTIPILHDLYRLANNLSREITDVKEAVELILKELNSCALQKIRDSFYKQNNSHEPILYFYETFLREYDKQTKKKRGAYYTPKPVVDFIVKSIDTILKEDFGLKDGVMQSEVKLLDPATGTGTFLASTIELIKSKIDTKYKVLNLEKEQFIKEVSNHILHNFYGFEFMMAPYAVAHIKLSLLLKTLGFDFAMTADDDDPDNDRWKIYLANTLDDPSKEPNSLFGFNNLANEAKLAKTIKNQKDIIAIIGNPPYSGSSQNPSRDEKKKLTWIGEQIEVYKYDGAKKLDEKNPKWLQDDYVKFIRFAQYQIDNAGYGAIGHIVPHGFLDNPTFRYMRKSLLKSFSKIYILDLHGNDNKKEKDSEGNKDENVFDIKTGVCIALFVKEKKSKECEVYHGDLYGKREEKFHTLENFDFKNLCQNKLHPKGDMSYFIPREDDSKYIQFWSVKDIFEVQNTGIVSKRDGIVFHDKKEQLISLLKDFKELDENSLRQKLQISPDSRDWKVSFAKNTIEKFGIQNEHLVQASYRPFEVKWTYFVNKSKGFMAYPVYNVMKHMLKPNISIITNRTTKRDMFNSIFVSNRIIDLHILETASASAYVFPLYLYDKNEASLFEEDKVTNFTNEFAQFKQKSFPSYSDEDIFYYIYGLLYAPNYRAKYNEFLKTDFPRIDFGYDIVKISHLGKELSKLHLLSHEIFDKQDEWNLKVEGKDFTISFAKKADIFQDDKIYLNPSTYIGKVDEETFKFMIGGYQVLDKWLSDRKNNTLSVDEIIHYMKIIISLRETIRIMKALDEVVK